MSRRRFMGSVKKLTEIIEEIKSSTNWTVPSGVYSIDIYLCGGGGGGARAGGGGGGGYGESVYSVSVTPGQVIPVTVGLGGAC